MEIVLLTPVRLMADGLAACLLNHREVNLCGVVSDLAGLRTLLDRGRVDLALIDVTQGVDLYDVRTIALDHGELAIVALGLVEQRQQVIRCGRAGFSGYVSRDATAEQLCAALCDVMAGRQACPAEISSGLLRALFRADIGSNAVGPQEALTRRENEVLALIGQGLSNKEIARELVLSVATVKHHVHRVLEKMQLQRRAQLMRRVRDAPWLVVSGRGIEPAAARSLRVAADAR